jgi:exopolysaccharide biosynthesis polyprenyl glycosylphosphotransferase
MHAFEQVERILSIDTGGALAAPEGATSGALRRERNASSWARGRRGRLVGLALACGDLLALAVAFVGSEAFLSVAEGGHIGQPAEYAVFFSTLPGWLIVAKLHGLYDHEGERAGQASVEEVSGVFHLVTVGAWLLIVADWILRSVIPDLTKVIAFWVAAILLVTLARALARDICRRSRRYVQRTLVVGADGVGRLVARKLKQHPEYGLDVVRFVDDGERADGSPLASPVRLPELVHQLDIDRVIVAFPNQPIDELLPLLRPLRRYGVQVDIVPRLHELIGPKLTVHRVEALPLLGVPPSLHSVFARAAKRVLDLVGAGAALVLTAPLFLLVAWRIKRDSPGPVFYRQQRLGIGMREFTMLKFRTMRTGVHDAAHRAYIAGTMNGAAARAAGDLYKLERTEVVTAVGRWLRKTSLDELPQLINVLRGEMSLVGPRPCIPYETEHFAPHHFERFLVPPGMTGLWQVTARARSSFLDALEMDVAYARGWSLGLDLKLLCRTPLQVLRSNATA